MYEPITYNNAVVEWHNGTSRRIWLDLSLSVCSFSRWYTRGGWWGGDINRSSRLVAGWHRITLVQFVTRTFRCRTVRNVFTLSQVCYTFHGVWNWSFWFLIGWGGVATGNQPLWLRPLDLWPRFRTLTATPLGGLSCVALGAGRCERPPVARRRTKWRLYRCGEIRGVSPQPGVIQALLGSQSLTVNAQEGYTLLTRST